MQRATKVVEYYRPIGRSSGVPLVPYISLAKKKLANGELVAVRDVRKVVQAKYQGIRLSRCVQARRMAVPPLLAITLTINVLRSYRSRDVEARCYKSGEGRGKPKWTLTDTCSSRWRLPNDVFPSVYNLIPTPS